MKKAKAIKKIECLKIINALEKKYSSSKVALSYRTPFQLLVATILSAQCTDKRVNIVTNELFKKYKTVSDYANARQAVFEKDIQSIGFYRNKARNIIAMANIISSEYGGKVPGTMERLVMLPGVARKTANVILHTVFKKSEGIAVDTHVRRLSRRLRFSVYDNPVMIEKDLMHMFPKKKWGSVTNVLIAHGREVCVARKARCEICCVSRMCPSRER